MSAVPEHPEGGDTEGAEDDLPVLRAQSTPEEVPGFLDRALEHLRGVSGDEDFSFEGVDFENAVGVWLAAIGVYDPDADTEFTPERIAAGEKSRWGRIMLDWETAVRRAMREAWGEPMLHTPRLVGDAEEPEGILDYLMISQEFARADLWDRGEMFVALLTDWSGEPAASLLRQILIVLPREFMMRGMGALLDGDAEVQEFLMHGEQPQELRRRAWLMSTIYDRGEVRVRDAPIEAVRCSIRSVRDVVTVWIFADDGRQLLLMRDPTCEFAEVLEGLSDDGVRLGGDAGYRWSEEQLVLMDRMLQGVPMDLLACVAAPGETAVGDVAEHALEFGILGDRPVPIITGAVWFDGESWRATPGIAEIAYQQGLAMGDFGFLGAVGKPYRLGGEFTPEAFTPPGDDERLRVLQQVFDACPFPAQPRPEGDACLGYGIPRAEAAGFEEMVEAVDRAAAAWWDREPSDVPLGDDTFKVGGRRLGGSAEEGVIDAILATSESWTFEALQQWTERLSGAMTERWGEPLKMEVLSGPDGAGRRTPLTRLIRASGFEQCPLWWVNGHAVVLLSGIPDPAYHDVPLVIVGIATADSVVEMLGRMSIWEARRRARLVEELAALVSAEAAEGAETARSVPWQGSALPGSDIVPPARRIVHRAGGFRGIWHLTHDGRGLLTSHPLDGHAGSLADHAELFEGVPEDLLPLAHGLPPAAAVFFHDGMDWRAPREVLRRAYAASRAQGVTPLAALYAEETGVSALTTLMLSGGPMSMERLTHPRYGDLVFGRSLEPEEVDLAYDRLGEPLPLALTGSLNDLLDVILDGPGGRFLLDAALSNPDPRNRREISLWLMREDLDASDQLSFMTPVNVLLANPTLDGGDAAVLRRLLASGADAGSGLLGPSAGPGPLDRLLERDLDGSALAPLLEVLREPDGA